MSPVAPAACGSCSPAPCGTPPSDVSAVNGSLLPDPDMSALGSADPSSLLYLLESKDQQLTVEAGSTRLQGLQGERNQQLVHERQAIAQQDAAAKHHGFWSDFGSIMGDVAKVAGIVAAVAATVCSFGAAGPVAALAIAGIVLSSASFIDGECHVLQKLGVDAKVAGWVDTGMAVAGAVCSFGAGAVSAGGTAVDTASAVGRATSVVGRTASVAAGAAAIGGGAAQIEAGQAQASCDQAAADQVQAAAQSAHELRFMQMVISETESSDADSKQILKTIVVTKAMQNTTALDCASGLRG